MLFRSCRNLIATAQKVSVELNGRFPNTPEGLLSLKGVGPYTAAAIGSFAFGLPLAVVDGNVIRVISRFLGITQPVDRPRTKKNMELMAQELLDEKNPAVYNQAIMDFGAVVCKPQQPLCDRCPLKKKCVAFNEGIQSSIPRKTPKTKAQVRYLNYLILEHKGRQLVRKRSENDIWKDLYEFVLLEKDEPQDMQELQNLKSWGLKSSRVAKQVMDVSDEIIHQLTHRKIICRLVHIRIEEPIQLQGYEWKTKNAILQLPFPRLITRYLNW